MSRDQGYVPHPIPGPLWRACEALLGPPTASGGQLDLTDVALDLRTNAAQLWVVRDGGVLVSAVVTRRNALNELEIWLYGGRLIDVPLLATIEDAARHDGIIALTLDGRRGWERVLKRYGWITADVGLRKALR